MSNLDAFLLGMVAADLDPCAPRLEDFRVELLNHQGKGFLSASLCKGASFH